MDKIKADGRLLATDPNHRGKVKIPINCGVFNGGNMLNRRKLL